MKDERISGTSTAASGCLCGLTEEPIHGYQFNPNDPYRANLDRRRNPPSGALNSLDNEIQPDPELAEGPASGAKVAMFAVAIAVVMGAVFYGLNNTSVQPGRHLADQPDRADAAGHPAAPPGMRDVTPAHQQPSPA